MTQARNAADLVNSAVLGGNLTIGNTTISATSVASDAFAPNAVFGGFMRNRLINGNMQVWQRGTSGFTTLNNFVYVADRMYMFSGLGMNATASQATSIGLSGFQYAMRAQRNSGNTATTALLIGQTIESVNCYDLAGKTITVSFWARAGANFSPTGNALAVYLVTGTGTDQGTLAWIQSTWTGQARATMGTATLTTSWQQFTYSVAVPSGTNEVAWYLDCAPTGTAGANDYYDITGVQLEVGSTATQFERRPYGLELALCQRYYEVIANDTSFGFLNPLGSTATIAATTFFKVTKRAVPTVSVGTGAVQAIGYNTATSYQSTAGGSWYFPSGVYISAEL